MVEILDQECVSSVSQEFTLSLNSAAKPHGHGCVSGWREISNSWGTKSYTQKTRAPKLLYCCFCCMIRHVLLMWSSLIHSEYVFHFLSLNWNFGDDNLTLPTFVPTFSSTLKFCGQNYLRGVLQGLIGLCCLSASSPPHLFPYLCYQL